MRASEAEVESKRLKAMFGELDANLKAAGYAVTTAPCPLPRGTNALPR